MTKTLNKFIRILIYSDLALLSGIGFMAPVFAIFLTDNIKGGGVEVAGFAAAIYWIIKSIVIIPIGTYLDRKPSEKVDLWFIVGGNILVAASTFGYIFSSLPWHIYLFEAIYGLGVAMNVPGYTAIFTRHISSGKEATSWSVKTAIDGIGSGIAGALGGLVAASFGFAALFVGVGILTLISALLPLFILNELE
ncbi:MAG: MFS transporter [Candidatus Portnoybacteria bacterium]|nr:MFS transporter [Candidatus Portnoybacteria bacterium]